MIAMPGLSFIFNAGIPLRLSVTITQEDVLPLDKGRLLETKIPLLPFPLIQDSML